MRPNSRQAGDALSTRNRGVGYEPQEHNASAPVDDSSGASVAHSGAKGPRHSDQSCATGRAGGKWPLGPYPVAQWRKRMIRESVEQNQWRTIQWRTFRSARAVDHPHCQTYFRAVASPKQVGASAARRCFWRAISNRSAKTMDGRINGDRDDFSGCAPLGHSNHPAFVVCAQDRQQLFKSARCRRKSLRV